MPGIRMACPQVPPRDSGFATAARPRGARRAGSWQRIATCERHDDGRLRSIPQMGDDGQCGRRFPPRSVLELTPLLGSSVCPRAPPASISARPGRAPPRPEEISPRGARCVTERLLRGAARARQLRYARSAPLAHTAFGRRQSPTQAFHEEDHVLSIGRLAGEDAPLSGSRSLPIVFAY